MVEIVLVKDIDEIARSITAWRGFAAQAADIANGRSHDWAALRRLRVTAEAALHLDHPQPGPCARLITLSAEIATAADYRAHFDEIHALCREVKHRCAMAEMGVAMFRQILGRAA